MSLLIASGLVAPMNVWGQFDDLEVTLTSAARAYCHVIRFPQAWILTPFDKVRERLFFGAERSDYEFRVEGVLSTKFLVAGFTESVGTNYYTNNRFRIDLADPAAPIVAVGRKAWDEAAVVPLTQKSAFPPIGVVPNEKRLEFHGFQFNRVGAIWAQPYSDATRLSPDQAWLVLLSRDKKNPPGPVRVFFEFYNADTGSKLFAMQGTFFSIANDNDPDALLGKTGWLTERYFIVPLGKKIERCLVCDFGGRNSEKGKK